MRSGPPRAPPRTEPEPAHHGAHGASGVGGLAPTDGPQQLGGVGRVSPGEREGLLEREPLQTFSFHP